MLRNTYFVEKSVQAASSLQLTPLGWVGACDRFHIHAFTTPTFSILVFRLISGVRFPVLSIIAHTNFFYFFHIFLQENRSSTKLAVRACVVILCLLRN
jgi:hypothetical protein